MNEAEATSAPERAGPAPVARGLGRILVVDDDPGMRRMIAKALGREGYSTETAATGEEALRLFGEGRYDVVVADIVMAPMDGLQLLARIRHADPAVPVVMVTAHGTVESAVEAMKRGAFDYLAKPFAVKELALVVAKALDRVRLLDERAYLHEEISRHYDSRGIVGRSPKMRRVFDLAASVSPSEANVLITGESGTGKELLARSIHEASRRKDGPFVVLNCGALAEGVLESELFGHERGAFTGAHRQRKGRFELAHRGTLFIDEVGELSPGFQVRLLRVLQEREFERVGGNEVVRVDVRILSATNRNLREEVQRGRFREDLYYRLNVVEIPLPPLRDRRDDVPPLAEYFLQRYARETRKPVTSISPMALEVLRRYDWPGNVRELENALERAVVLCRGEAILPSDLPMGLSGEPQDVLEMPSESASLPAMLDDLERQIIRRTLVNTGYSQTRTAELLGIARTTLRYKMEKYRLLGSEE